MAEEFCDVVVVGAGIEGSATAYWLSKQGYTTVLLEQYSLPHSRGSSHGQSRITRKAYLQQHYARMMLEAYPAWEELEREETVHLYKKTGTFAFDNGRSASIQNVEKALEGIGVGYQSLNNVTISKQFPQFRLPQSVHAVFEPDGGILKADKALRAFQSQFVKHGGFIRDEEKVTDIRPGKNVLIYTNKGKRYNARSVVITAGPWTNQLVRPLGVQLPLKPVRVSVYYFQEKTLNHSVKDGFPCFIYYGHPHVYGLPADEYPNQVKVAYHGGPEIHPDQRDQDPEKDIEIKNFIIGFVRDTLPGLSTTPSVVEKCIYTMTPDEEFILDRHPEWDNIVIGAGFSGHGFKLSPVVGKILSQLATGRQTSHDLEPFRISRFDKGNTSKL